MMSRFALILMLLASPVMGHSFYDPECCSDKDCAPVDQSFFQPKAEGWLVTIPEGGHPYAGSGVQAFYMYDDPRIRISEDGDFHACIIPALPESSSTPYLACIYIPPISF